VGKAQGRQARLDQCKAELTHALESVPGAIATGSTHDPTDNETRSLSLPVLTSSQRRC
jgi:hypothetical protein